MITFAAAPLRQAQGTVPACDVASCSDKRWVTWPSSLQRDSYGNTTPSLLTTMSVRA